MASKAAVLALVGLHSAAAFAPSFLVRPNPLAVALLFVCPMPSMSRGSTRTLQVTWALHRLPMAFFVDGIFCIPNGRP